MVSDGKHIRKGRCPSRSLRLEICGLIAGVLSVTALVTVYQNEAWDECGPNLYPTKTVVIEPIWDRVHNFNLSHLYKSD